VLLAATALVIVAALAAALLDRARDEVAVFPGVRTLAADPSTAITFRGVAAGALDDLVVTGSRSGPHTGRIVEHPDGRGAAFVPDEPFAAGERVTVDTGITSDETSFVIARALSVPDPPFDAAKPATDPHVQAFRSRPDLRPPAVNVRARSGAAAAGNILVAPKRGATQVGPMILDDQGTLVWFHPLDGDRQAFDFRAQEFRGRPVLTWWEGHMATYRGAGVGRIVDRFYREVAVVRGANGYDFDAHEFQLTPAGTALIISYVPVPWDLSELGGRRDGIVEDNVVQEIDVATGAVLFEWHALGTIGLGESYRSAPTKRGKMHDPFHLNSVTLDRDGNLLVSARHANAIYKLDRRTGELIWRLGGKRSDFELAPGAEFALQHDAERRADGAITLFDNVAEDLPARGRRSRALALRLDEAAGTASVARSWEHPEALLSPTQGSTQNLDGGGVFVGWGGLQPYFSEFSADGRVVFDARFVPDGVETYRAYRYPWDGAGDSEPAAVARRDGRRTTVYASWNGAIGVARWRVRAPGVPRAVAPRAGFETAIRVDGAPDEVVVEALDASGAVLGTATVTPGSASRPSP
jgi:outer membrane protein assembly factor BamB